MTITNSRPYSVQPLTSGLRLSAIGRRVSASGPLAIVITDLAYGEPRCNDLGMLQSVTTSRCVSYAEAR